MNRAEATMGPLLRGALSMMLHAKIGMAFWGDALLHSATCMNMGPRPGLQIPREGPLPESTEDMTTDQWEDDRMPFTPQGALLHMIPDVSALTVPLFSDAYVHIQGTKASQLRATSRRGLFAGLPENTVGFKIRPYDDLKRKLVTIHTTFDTDMGRRPMTLTCT